MYSIIKNPNNGKLYSVNSKIGNKIIKKYITNLLGGASATSYAIYQTTTNWLRILHLM